MIKKTLEFLYAIGKDENGAGTKENSLAGP